MSKHQHKSKEEQVFSKAHDEATKSEDISTKAADENAAIQLRAYQIHLEKGGSDLDNWLEAERCLKNNDKAVSRLINEGDPNIQK